jgi:hypothetical protein
MDACSPEGGLDCGGIKGIQECSPKDKEEVGFGDLPCCPLLKGSALIHPELLELSQAYGIQALESVGAVRWVCKNDDIPGLRFLEERGQCVRAVPVNKEHTLAAACLCCGLQIFLSQLTTISWSVQPFFEHENLETDEMDGSRERSAHTRAACNIVLLPVVAQLRPFEHDNWHKCGPICADGHKHGDVLAVSAVLLECVLRASPGNDVLLALDRWLKPTLVHPGHVLRKDSCLDNALPDQFVVEVTDDGWVEGSHLLTGQGATPSHLQLVVMTVKKTLHPVLSNWCKGVALPCLQNGVGLERELVAVPWKIKV